MPCGCIDFNISFNQISIDFNCGGETLVDYHIDRFVGGRECATIGLSIVVCIQSLSIDMKF